MVGDEARVTADSARPRLRMTQSD